MYVRGVDVSRWQGDIDWAKLASKTRFVFIKVSQARFTDPRFETNWNQSRDRLLRGGYHFYEPGEDPRGQAAYFASTLAATGDIGELPPVLDLERGPVTWGEVVAFMEEVQQRTGRTPILYTTVSFMQSQGLANPYVEAGQPYPLWIAWYGRNDGRPPNYIGPELPWRGTWAFWQYTSKGPGREYGVSSRYIDLNFFHGNQVALVRFLLGLKWWRGDGEEEEIPTPIFEKRRWRVTARALFIRAGPGIRYRKRGFLRRGAVVEVEEVSDQGQPYAPWGRIGPDRWISLRFAEPLEE